MKIKKKSEKAVETSAKSSKSSVEQSRPGFVRIKHYQSIRQVIGYQSAEASYGVEFEVPEGAISVQAGFEKAERMIEGPLVAKHEVHNEMLRKVAAMNNNR